MACGGRVSESLTRKKCSKVSKFPAFPCFRSELQGQFETTETTENLKNLLSGATKGLGCCYHKPQLVM